jgi:hypothetical protein
MCIADRDFNRDARHERIKKQLDTRYEVLRCNEIENLLSPNAIAKILKVWLGAEIKPEFFNAKELQDRRLGAYIDEVLENRRLSLNHRKKGFASSTGTLNDKEKFCSIAMKEITELTDFISYGAILAEKLSNFIGETNSR